MLFDDCNIIIDGHRFIQEYLIQQWPEGALSHLIKNVVYENCNKRRTAEIQNHHCNMQDKVT
jgi:hypothetical protein